MNKPDAPDVRKVAETALDLFVYAPVGLAFEARSLLPKLAQRGRNQIVLARFGARFARQRAEAEAERLLQQLQDRGVVNGANGKVLSMPSSEIQMTSPGSISRTQSASIISSAQDSLARM